jgi:hypothetical protein
VFAARGSAYLVGLVIWWLIAAALWSHGLPALALLFTVISLPDFVRKAVQLGDPV